ncbi:hypothetical protein GGR58DRAFT_524874 [Xylaria digitata]|nr:hypothetical protein GGR58DRAFT_524874 [Xylaria digitata]
MDASKVAAFTSMANMICCKSTIDPIWARVDLHMIVEALHHKLSESALPQKQTEIADVHFWIALTKRAARILDIPYSVTYQRINRALPSRFVVGNLHIRDKAPLAQTLDHKSSKNNNNQAAPTNAANPKDGQESVGSDALSDTSFTPPKNIGKCVRYDEDGRRHVILPPGVLERAAKERFVQEDKNRQRKLLPSPGPNNLAPEHILEAQQEPERLTFERKRNFKKSAVKYGGISLSMMREQPQRFEKLKQMRSEK